MPAGRLPWSGGPTEDIRKAICGLISKRSLPMSHASAMCGVHPRTAQRWLEQGGKDIDAGHMETPHAVFAMSTARARAHKTNRILKQIEAAAKIPSNVTGQTDPKPLMWLLEKTEHGEFTQHAKVEIDATIRDAEDPRDRLARLLGPLAPAGAAAEVDPKPES